MDLISRRNFCLGAGTALSLVFPFVSAAVPPSEPEPTAALLYAQGVRMLREGRTFEKAAAHFARAAEKEPSNPDYPIALGCAFASRVASLAWAGAFAERLQIETAAYPKLRLTIAEGEAKTRKELDNKNADKAGREKFESDVAKFKIMLKPPTGRVFLIKYDKALYRLTPPELIAQLTLLSKEAQAAWEKGVALCQTPEEKAHARYVCGWGLRLVRFYGDRESEWRKTVLSPTIKYPDDETPPLVEPSPPLLVGRMPTNEQITTAFRETTETAPDKALCWQAWADFLAARERANPGAEVTEQYRRAALLEPKNANLWNRVYNRETAVRWTEKQSDAPAALDDLHHAQARDKSNAWFGYEEAGRVFKTAPWSRSADLPSDAPEKEQQAARETPRTPAGYAAAKRAVALMEQANGLPRFVPPVYQNSVPALLEQAWNYVPVFWYENTNEAWQARFRALSRACYGYAESLTHEKNNIGEATRVLRVVEAMGMRVIGGDPWPTGRDADGRVTADDKAVTRALVGIFIVRSVYTSLVIIVKESGDGELVKSATDEQTGWQVRVKKWINQLPRQEVDAPSLYDIYDRN